MTFTQHKAKKQKLNYWSDSVEIGKDIRNHKTSFEEELERFLDDDKFESDIDALFALDSGLPDPFEIWFSETPFEEETANAIDELFQCISETREKVTERVSKANSSLSNTNRRRLQSHINVSRMQLDRCAGNVYSNRVITSALRYDVLEVLCVDGRLGNYDLLTSDALSNLSSPIHLKELDLRYFRITAENVETLQKGILNPALRKSGGGLKRLSLCNTTFRDDAAVEKFADVLAPLTQKPKQINGEQQENEEGNFLESLWLYYSNLEDHHLEKIMQSLMTANDTGVESTLKSLTVEQAKCGPKFYELLGAWLLDCETPLLSSPRESRSLCMLEVVNIFIWSAVSPASVIDPVEIMTRQLPWRKNADEADEEKKNEIDAMDKKVNTVLKTLCLSGVSNMEHLGRFSSEHLLGLESLQLHSRGSNDTGLTTDEFSRFVAGSTANSPIELRPKDILIGGPRIMHPGNVWLREIVESTYDEYRRSSKTNHNRVLRKLTFHCADKETRTKLESCSFLEQLLIRYPMLYDVKFGFKRSGSPRDKVQQMMDENASGRFLFFPPAHKPAGLPVSLWPTVLVGFHNRLTAESESMYDDNMRAWVESGSFGDGVGEDDDDFEDSEDEGDEVQLDGDEDDENNNDGERIELDMKVVHGKNSKVFEQSATAIFSLLKQNIEGLMLLQKSEETQKKLKRNMETLSISETVVDNSKKLRREDSR